MSREPSSYRAAERLAQALMFEGYVLYPYRRSSLKNMQRFAFGTLKAKAGCAPGTSDASALRVECLVLGDAVMVDVSVRFLQYARRDEAGVAEPWIEAIERVWSNEATPVSALASAGREIVHELGSEQEQGHDPSARQTVVLRLRVVLTAQRLSSALFRLRIDVENAGEGGEPVLSALGAAHVLLRAQQGRFVSLLEPPSELAEHAGACCNRGCFPVLVGPAAHDDVMLASPIILYDRPSIAPESAGDFCDATEIDEMLSLRVLTLTDDERREAERTDDKSRAIIERTHAQNEDALLALHGARRDPAVHAFAPGDAVRLCPKKGGDILDLALRGERATIASVEEDFEGRLHYAVTVDADPGRDLGVSGMPGHRFFFSAEELERLS